MKIVKSLSEIMTPSEYAKLEWKTLPPGIERPLPPELQIEWDRERAEFDRLGAERTARRAAQPGLYNDTPESHTMNETNVALLDEDGVKEKIRYIRRLIESGEAKNYTFSGGNGDKATDSIHQFLFWLMERAHSFDSDGTYTPEMFK